MVINRNNYEEFFLLYVDGELSAGDRIAVEKFVSANPDLLEELNLLKETVLVADNSITFEHKEELYKEEKKVIGFYWWRVAAAVILLFGVGTWGWLHLNEKAGKKEISQTSVVTTSPVFPANIPPPAADTQQRHDGAEYVQTKERRPRTIEASTTRRQIRVSTTPQPLNKEEITLTLPTNLSVTSIEPPKENIAAIVAPQQIEEETKNTPTYEYVDLSEENEEIYVANTSISKRNKFRGVIRKATRILDRVTSTN